MKNKKYLFLIITFILSFGCALFVAIKVFPNNPFTGSKPEKAVKSKFEDGDIIFQTSESKQCEAVRIATNSKFSHCGIIYDIDGKWFVFEAVQPVKLTPIEDWITHGKGNKYVVKRFIVLNWFGKFIKIARVLNYQNCRSLRILTLMTKGFKKY
jgi:hypothetical protein